MRDSFCWLAFSALSGLQSDVMLCRTWELPPWYSKQECKRQFWVKLPYVYVYSRYFHIYFLCMCSYNLVVTTFLVSRTSLSKRLWAALVQEVTQYWLALHFLWADSPLLLSGCLPPPPSSSPSPPPSSITWLYVGALSSRSDPARLGLVWPGHRQWRRWLMSWATYTEVVCHDYFMSALRYHCIRGNNVKWKTHETDTKEKAQALWLDENNN